MAETTDVSFQPEAPLRTDVPSESPGKPTPPSGVEAPSVLPGPEEILAWLRGRDLPQLGRLFDGLTAGEVQALAADLRRERQLPGLASWAAGVAPRDPMALDRLPEIGRLRVRYKNQELSRRRVAQLRLVWEELGGRPPADWTVADLFTAMPGIIERGERGRPVDWTELLSALRDVWRDLEPREARERLTLLGRCLTRIAQR
ncbi:MAG TPA: hypothetical protein VMW27_15820 [Thermoanaerobaculia bacterium]|nr:hypothetical protein [Thermoanaerobaculia bacterium]